MAEIDYEKTAEVWADLLGCAVTPANVRVALVCVQSKRKQRSDAGRIKEKEPATLQVVAAYVNMLPKVTTDDLAVNCLGYKSKGYGMHVMRRIAAIMKLLRWKSTVRDGQRVWVRTRLSAPVGVLPTFDDENYDDGAIA